VTVALSANGIVVRPHAQGDVAPMYAAVCESMATVGRWMAWCHLGYAMHDAQAWYERCAAAWACGGDRELAIFDATSGDVLGCVGINQINRVNQFANMGYWVRASRTGAGIASNAARLASRFGFASLGLARIEIVVLPDNGASRRVAEKVGARFEGLARNRLLFGIESRDAAMYSLVRGDLPHG
jgi:RimJ/RimL family protein N-acetyltransferase